MKPETKIVLPALEVDVIGDVHTDPRNHPSRVARVSAETARANSVTQAQWIDHTTAPRGLLTSAHAYVAAADGSTLWWTTSMRTTSASTT